MLRRQLRPRMRKAIPMADESKLIAPSVAQALTEGVGLYHQEIIRARAERQAADARVVACEAKLEKALAMLARIIAKAPDTALKEEETPSGSDPR